MLVGWGGNNGSTITAALEANRKKLEWRTKNGIQKANWFGSITQASTVLLGSDNEGKDVHVPMNHLVPMVNPDDIGLLAFYSKQSPFQSYRYDKFFPRIKKVDQIVCLRFSGRWLGYLY